MADTVTLGAEVWQLKLALTALVTTAAELYELLEILGQSGFPLERIDIEPIRRPYCLRTIEDIFGAFKDDEAPCWTMVGRRKANHGFISARCCRPTTPNGSSVNILGIHTGRRKAQIAVKLAEVVERFLVEGRVGWAEVDRWEVYRGQLMPGTINDRLDGVFWANAFSTAYVEAIGRDVLLSIPWARAHETPGGIMAWLYDEPGVLPIDLIERRHEARRIIGEEKFLKKRWGDLPQLGRYNKL